MYGDYLLLNLHQLRVVEEMSALSFDKVHEERYFEWMQRPA